MQFRTELKISESKFKIEHHDALFFMGSCFAENIAEKSHMLLFNTCINPHGILYNPKSIATAISEYCTQKIYKKEDLFFFDNWWHSWNHHSRFSNTDINLCLENINKNISIAFNFLQKSKFLFITLGSAFIYKYVKSNSYVANCHKVPNKEFEKELLTIDSIICNMQSAIDAVNYFNKEIKIIFTVSPVRYIRDGIVENTLSKARLLESVHQLCNKNNNCYYFPAYELIMDDLRDYRFFKEDLVHPSEMAINYVWEKFSNCFFSNQCLNIIKEIEEIVIAENHQPRNINSESYLSFKKNVEEKKQKLTSTFPYIKFN